MNHRMHQQAGGIDQDMPLLATDFLPRIVACQSALNSFQGTASKNFQFVSLISIVFCVA
jgi:hypothetical protein